MTPQEKIMEVVEKHYGEYDDHTTGQIQNSKEECYKCAEEMHQWTKEQMIEKALVATCNLCQDAKNCTFKGGDDCPKAKYIKKAMEEL